MAYRILLYLGAVFYLATGAVMLAGPQDWYLATPGVEATGGFNAHFIVDIGFAFLVSGALVAAGTWLRRRELILGGLAWPVLHGIFHVAGLALHGAVSAPALWTEVLLVIAPAAVLVAAALAAPLTGLGLGMSGLVHAGLRRFERQWNYDATYLHRMADLMPDSLAVLNGFQAFGGRRGTAPLPLLHGAALAASLKEDCGPCAQITIDKIRAAGADAAQLRALVRRDFDRAHPLSVLGFRFAEAVLAGDPVADPMREGIEERYGEAAVAELAWAVVVARAYPTLKRTMGYGAACQRLDVDGQSETVVAA